MSSERLPLFPLKTTVLFPGAVLPLHIFEERYRLMIGRCIDERAPFGVLLIREGEEVGPPAEPYDLGTTAHIARVQRLPDGRMNLICLGARRFRVLALDTREPYLVGDVSLLASEDVDAPQVPDLVEQVAALFGEQRRLSMALSDQWVRRVDLPEDPDRLTDFVANQVEVPPETKQELLETLSLPARLRREVELLNDLVDESSRRWEQGRREKFAGARLN